MNNEVRSVEYVVINEVTGREYGYEDSFLFACAMRNRAVDETGIRHYVRRRTSK